MLLCNILRKHRCDCQAEGKILQGWNVAGDDEVKSRLLLQLQPALVFFHESFQVVGTLQ
jgi:hypothetical protein